MPSIESSFYLILSILFFLFLFKKIKIAPKIGKYQPSILIVVQEIKIQGSLF
jgi:hypothetical protein